MDASTEPRPAPVVRRLGRVDYPATVAAMRTFTDARGPRTPDELWLVEHEPVYTLGLKRKNETHPASLHGIPLVQTDRGGDITYHGPGQLVIYLLLDLNRLRLGIRPLVALIEQCLLDQLAAWAIPAARRAGAPGVYVRDKKIAALGLRVRHCRTYHGLSLNVAMDLAPFDRIHPCGYEGLKSTSLAELGIRASLADSADDLARRLLAALGYTALRSDSTGLPHRKHG